MVGKDLTIKPQEYNDLAHLKILGYYYTQDPFVSGNGDYLHENYGISAIVFHQNGSVLLCRADSLNGIDSILSNSRMRAQHRGAWGRFQIQYSLLFVQSFEWSNGLSAKSAKIMQRDFEILNDSSLYVYSRKLKLENEPVFQTYKFRKFQNKGDSTNWLNSEWLTKKR